MTSLHVHPYISLQIAARQRSAVVKLKYLNFRSKYPSGLLIAVEGNEDKVVYSHWISRVRPSLSYEFFVCDGKKGVRQLKNSLFNDMNENEHDILYFVDRDFDDLSGFDDDSRVFMLDRYSIENYLVDVSVVDRFLRSACSGNQVSLYRKDITEQFRTDYDAFLRCSKGVNERIFVSRRMKFDIDDIMPDSIIDFAIVEYGSVVRGDVSDESILPYPADLDEDNEANLKEEFSSLDPVTRYRGKYAIKFINIWFQKLNRNLKNNAISGLELNEGGVKLKIEESTIGGLAAISNIPPFFSEFFAKNEI